MSSGKLYIVGVGPGSHDHMTFRAKEVITQSDTIVGYDTYIGLVEDLIQGKEIHRYKWPPIIGVMYLVAIGLCVMVTGVIPVGGVLDILNRSEKMVRFYGFILGVIGIMYALWIQFGY